MAGPLHLYIHKPAVVLSGQVNQTSFTYPIGQVDVDNLSGGVIGDAKAGMTVVFGTVAGYSNRGRTRLRLDGLSGTLYMARNSRGRNPTGGNDSGRDGEVDLSDDLFFEVWDDRRIWAKAPVLTPVGDGITVYKDGFTSVASNMNNSPPVAHGGRGFAGTIDGSNIITVDFDSAESFATADGATIDSVLWDVDDGTITTGTTSSTAITATFPAGFRYVSLTVTDSNAVTHTTYIPVFARDPASDETVAAFDNTTLRLSPQGAELSVRILSDLDALDYPDGTLVMLWEGEAASAADRSHMRFIGWHNQDPGSIDAGRTATLTDVVLECVDAAGRLRQLPGYSQEITSVAAGNADRWFKMPDANLDKYIHYLLHWHSTALEVAPFTWSGTGSTYAFKILGSDADDLYTQVQRVAQSFVPRYHFTGDHTGRLRVLVDPMLQDEDDRTATVQATYTGAEWASIRAQHMPVPRVRTLRGGALLAGNITETPLFCIAPGDAPGQGRDEWDRESQAGLTPSQSVLNSATGHAYARANGLEGLYTIQLAAGEWPGLNPADMTWINLTVPSDLTTPRARSGTARLLMQQVNVRYSHARTGLLADVEIQAENETRGQSAKTVIVETAGNPPADDDEWWGGDDYWSDNYPVEPGVPGDTFYGDPAAYILWDGTHVIRTWDIMAASPTWELVDTGITGTIKDGQYVTLSNTAGMWLMTTAAIWWCEDIMATTPVWDDVLTLATVQATDATPPSGSVEFKSMFQGEDSNPGFLIVATGIDNQNVSSDYEHAYFWITQNYGASWTQVDMNSFLFETLGVSRGYGLCGLHGINMHRSSGTIFAMRAVYAVGAAGRVAVFVSENYGTSWAKRHEWEVRMRDTDSGAVLDPFPGINDLSWVVRGNTAAATSDLQKLYKSTDAWANATEITLPTGYNCVTGRWRPNRRTFDPDHLIAWHRNDSTGNGDLLETNNGGDTWSVLWASGIALSTGTNFVVNTPNGWPPLPDLWFVVRAAGSIGDPVIQITEDHFQTFSSREGNLNTLLGGAWANANGSGFALPKLGVNQ